MSWGAAPKRTREEFRRLTTAERDALTWEQAREFVEPDTLVLAMWSGYESYAMREGDKPAQALDRLFRDIGKG